MTNRSALEASVAYLESPLALAQLGQSSYWPKWDGAWWHMLLLFEMGEVRRIPAPTIRALIDALQATPVKIFAIQPDDMPDDAYDHCFCHCQIGNVYRVLDAAGVDVDAKLPWMHAWLLDYQMEDGGMNCDITAYQVAGECPSSMVGTIAAFEALVGRTRHPWSADERRFLDRAAGFMMGRQLMRGSDTRHNHAEQIAAQSWIKLCFPRFYHYDVLRGLAALTAWAERAETRIPREAVADAIGFMAETFPNGAVTIGRRCFEGQRTIRQRADGSWNHERQPADTFPLLDAVSTPGEISPWLSQQWRDVQPRLALICPS